MRLCDCKLFVYCVFFFFKQKTAYEMRISDWSSDVCSSDLSMSFQSAGMFCPPISHSISHASSPSSPDHDGSGMTANTAAIGPADLTRQLTTLRHQVTFSSLTSATSSAAAATTTSRIIGLSRRVPTKDRDRKSGVERKRGE